MGHPCHRCHLESERPTEPVEVFEAEHVQVATNLKYQCSLINVQGLIASARPVTIE